jgi:hypothetical protein
MNGILRISVKLIKYYIYHILFVFGLGYLAWFYTSFRATEAFGFSNGTLIQLQTSHVPTVEEVEEGATRYRKQVEHDLEAMTY